MQRIKSLLGAAFRGWAALGGFTKLWLCILLVIAGGVGPTLGLLGMAPLNWFNLEKDSRAPVDYGYGPGKGIGPPRPFHRLGQVPPKPRSQAPVTPKSGVKSGSSAQITVPVSGGAGGFFGPAFPWPIIALHMLLLPDGRVLNWGTDQTGSQGALLTYDVWDPSVGNVSNAHTVLSNTTSTDIFCAASSLLSQSPDTPGTALIIGGDAMQNGTRGYSNNHVNIFSPANNTLTPAGQMAFARWYPSLTTLINGDKLVLGGQLSPTPSPGVGEPTPELRSAATGWRTLTGISIDQNEWYYPRGFVAPDGSVTLIQQNGETFRLTTNGTGTQQDLGRLVDHGVNYYPSTMFF